MTAGCQARIKPGHHPMVKQAGEDTTTWIILTRNHTPPTTLMLLLAGIRELRQSRKIAVSEMDALEAERTAVIEAIKLCQFEVLL